MTWPVTDTPGPGRSPPPGEVAWHTLSAGQVLRSEGTDGRRGLRSAEAVARARRFGPNKLVAGKAEPRWRAFLRQYRDPMQIVLLAAGMILATLRREGVPATFFLTGNFVRDFPAAARSIAAAGFRVGDHTITHPYLTRLSDAAVRQEILGGARQIAAVTGRDPVPLFRFPFGDADSRVIAIANQAGYVSWARSAPTLPITPTAPSQSSRRKTGGSERPILPAPQPRR
ncbi:MAG: polysaccharide deacetylase family protein [Trebonia sp.]